MMKNTQKLPENTFSITESQIKERYKFLIDRVADETVRAPLVQFKKILYYSQFLYPANFYAHREILRACFPISEDIAVISQLWYQYLSQNGYLKLTASDSTLIGTDVYLSYSQTVFEWANMSEDFLDLFIYFIMAITSSYEKFCRSHSFSASEFFELIPGYIAQNCNRIPQDISQRSSNLYTTISEKFLEKNYLCALEDFYAKYKLTALNSNQQDNLRDSVRNLTFILICQAEHSEYISNCILHVLKKYMERLGESPNLNAVPNILFPYTKPIIITDFEKDSMNNSISTIAKEKDLCIERIHQTLHPTNSSQHSEEFTITSELVDILSDIKASFFNRLDQILKDGTYDLQSYYAYLTLLIKSGQNHNLLLQSIKAHNEILQKQLCDYCEALKKDVESFFKNIARRNNRTQKQDSIKSPVSDLTHAMKKSTEAAQQKFKSSISPDSKKDLRLPYIMQIPEHGLLNQHSYWHLPTSVSNFPTIAYRLLIDIKPQININELLEDPEIQNIFNRPHPGYIGRKDSPYSPLTFYDVLTFLHCIEQLEHKNN